jgi:deazaflavin-dependent oxidoreductase (nitroreductase family)
MEIPWQKSPHDPPLPAKPPSAIEAVFNRAFGWLVGLGLAPDPFYLLEVRGRKSGRIYPTPVDVLSLGDQRFLVAPRGHTQWVRNPKVSGVVTPRRGRTADNYKLREVEARDKPAILKAYQYPPILRSKNSSRLPTGIRCSS